MAIRRALPLALLILALLYRHGPEPNHHRTPQSPSPHQALSPTNLARTHTAVDSTIRPEIRHALARGLPLSFAIPGQASQQFLFRARRTLTEDFAIRVGSRGQISPSFQPEVYEGLALDTANTGAFATLAIAGDAIGAVIRRPNGDTTYLRTHPETGQWQAQSESSDTLASQCLQDPTTGAYQMQSDDPLANGESFWDDALTANLVPETAALTGIDPATNRLDKYINPIARTTRYDASLRDALLLLVLDKEATGSNTTANLASKASLFLATVSNVAAVYENQLGVRLLVQEMIMIPDSDDFEDVPFSATDGSITNFRTWIQLNRLNATYQWSMAIKFGAGLSGSTLGIAFVDAIRNNSAVGVCRSTARWDVLAHEMGHNLGSDHSSGGIMNATTISNNNRSFFTEVTQGETSAKDIYDYARTRLAGSATMRNPEQIPFANSDSESTLTNTPVTLSPLDNDDEQVINGAVNTLALEETSTVTPLGAGHIDILGNDIRFTPASDFQGTAWFSYSVRGNVGNNGQGWLHKGDVAITVGSSQPPTEIVLAPGASYSFFPITGTAGLTQPSQAMVSTSRDDSSLLIIRVHADASGSDTFRSGGRTFTLIYSAPSPRVTDDLFVYDSGRGSLTFNPLLNDEGAGEAWVNPIKPTIGVGTAGHNPNGDALFPTTFRLISATNRTPEKGNLTTRTLPFIINGSRVNQLDSSLAFTGKNGASGSAFIDYVVEDASGAQAAGVVEILLPFRIDTLVKEGDVARYLIPSNDSIDTSWMLPDFDDSTWTSGSTGFGYDSSADYIPAISTDVADLRGTNTSIFTRLAFQANSPSQYTQLSLRIKIDDGFVAYLNGEEIARSTNVPSVSPLPFNSEATQSTNDSQALTFASFDLSSRTDLLRDGKNVLAIHGLNSSLNSSDFLLVPELEASVTNSSITLVSPTSREISVPTNTGLSLKTMQMGAVANGVTAWSVIAGDSNAVSFVSESPNVHTARFSAPGTYSLRATVNVGTSTESTDLLVTAFSAATASSAASVDPGPRLELATYTAELQGTATPSDVEKVQWTQRSGPAAVFFSAPTTLTSLVGFPTPGTYQLRLHVTRKGIETHNDVTVETSPTEDSLAAMVTPPSALGPTSAELPLVSLFPQGLVDATLFLGRSDGNADPATWERVIPIGSVPPGAFNFQTTDLLFDTEYTYRFAIQRGDAQAISRPGFFRTQPSPLFTTSVIDASSPAQVFVPLDDNLGSTWTTPAFDDGAWTTGLSGVGFDLDVEFRPWIGTDVEAEMFEQSTSVYVRIPFTIGDPSAIEILSLQMRYDDAFVAYLNGQEIARSATAPQSTPINQSTAAAILREDIEAVELEAYDISEHTGLLRRGENVLAIHGLNFIPENRDLLVAPILLIEQREAYYQQWLAQFSLTEADGLVTADPDADGLINLQEYAFGTDPTGATSLLANIATIHDDFRITYQRRANATERGLRFQLEHSQNLIHWNLVDDSSEDILPSANIETVSTMVDPEDSRMGFWRIRVSLD